MNIQKIIQQHVNKHGDNNAVVLVVAYDDDLLLAALDAIQKIAPVKVELCTFPQFYNEQDTEKLIMQIREAKPTLIVNAAEHQWLAENVNMIGADIKTASVSLHDLRTLSYGRFDYFHP